MNQPISGSRPVLRRFPVLALLALALPAPATAQVRVVGRVLDDVTEQTVSFARVELLNAYGRVLEVTETDTEGNFSFDVEKGIKAIRLDVRRLGYMDNRTPALYFDGRTFFQVEIRLDVDAVLLAPLEVVARSSIDRSAVLDGYFHRLRTGQGIYITRDNIEARAPVFVTDLLRDVPGVTLVASGAGTRPVVQMSRSLARRCDTQIYIDGFLVNPRSVSLAGRTVDFRIDDVVHPGSVEGIEVYRGLSTIPAEFLDPDAAQCGVIAIWTRRGFRG